MDKEMIRKCILYAILESVFNDLKFDIHDISFSKDYLRFTLDGHMVIIDIDSDKNQYGLFLGNEIYFTGKPEENMLEECLTKICTIFNYENLREFNNYDVFFKFIQLSYFFDLKYLIYNKQMIIKCPSSEKEMLITEIEDSIYHLSLGEDDYYLPIGQQPKELYSTDFEYNVNLKKYSKFYDKDKNIQFVSYIGRLITKKET